MSLKVKPSHPCWLEVTALGRTKKQQSYTLGIFFLLGGPLGALISTSACCQTRKYHGAISFKPRSRQTPCQIKSCHLYCTFPTEISWLELFPTRVRNPSEECSCWAFASLKWKGEWGNMVATNKAALLENGAGGSSMCCSVAPKTTDKSWSHSCSWRQQMNCVPPPKLKELFPS